MATVEYLKSAKRQFLYYKTLGEKAMAQVDDAGLNWQTNEESNSIAVIVKHLWGNMLSRWTDFLTTDGEKPGRQRDAEFQNDWKGRDFIVQKWEEGWKILFDVLESLKPADLSGTITIRNQPLIVIDAINRQLAHYSSHVGQIIYIAKWIRNQEWQSLSIPKGSKK